MLRERRMQNVTKRLLFFSGKDGHVLERIFDKPAHDGVARLVNRRIQLTRIVIWQLSDNLTPCMPELKFTLWIIENFLFCQVDVAPFLLTP
jgi:hypothetical protein